MSVSTINETRQYLTFELDKEIFAIDVSQVKEVLDFTKITKIPRTPDFMLGVINLRGSVVPVIDIRKKFGMNISEITINTCIIVLEIEYENELLTIGAIADSVKEVFELEPKDIEPAPKIGTKMNIEFIKGMGKRNDDFVIILDINKIFTQNELEFINEKTQENEIIEENT
ncbi:MAG TPA: chemotaxis protein CheW [Ignavibacteriales bacterium]|nr:chemotaxis protein CheW [Ignavibacteriales bacterium]HOL80814.1 chemotaxis protein CheW [Ignavibacteriales bacterium]HOM66171.1 chemotaxis protein CheW [Ignavibacteriales bacterium]HPD68418.1 chemotaxis protein CheW [Ignavibacteriales bacterium]HPP33250.1 chemotaxis protein CheW [Ignavibacteriales bacterium]